MFDRKNFYDRFCDETLLADAIAQIRRDKAYIAAMEEIHELAVERIKGLTAQLKTARADAVRDVIRRVLGEAITIQDHRGNLGSVVTANDVERIAKEMTEGEG